MGADADRGREGVARTVLSGALLKQGLFFLAFAGIAFVLLMWATTRGFLWFFEIVPMTFIAVGIVGFLITLARGLEARSMRGVPQLAKGAGDGAVTGPEPTRAVVLYDGACPFCRAQVARLMRWVGQGAIEALDLNDASVPSRFPGLSREALLTAMHLVEPDGRVFTGFHAVVRALRSRPVLGRIAMLYYLPGIRQLAELIYRAVAKRRVRQTVGECADGACRRHS